MSNMSNTEEELKISEYAKVFIIMLLMFQDVEKALKWMLDYGAMYKQGEDVVNWADIRVTRIKLLNRIKIFIDLDKEEWDE